MIKRAQALLFSAVIAILPSSVANGEGSSPTLATYIHVLRVAKDWGKVSTGDRVAISQELFSSAPRKPIEFMACMSFFSQDVRFVDTAFGVMLQHCRTCADQRNC